MSDTPPFVVEIQGGLGNQLFGLAFAQHISKQRDRSFIVSNRMVDKGITRHGVRIEDFDMDVQFISDPPMSEIGERVFNGICRRTRKIPLIKNLMNTQTYLSMTVGFDADAASFDYRRYRGYFQSYVYAQSLKEILPEGLLSMKYPSPWLDTRIKQAKDLLPIMMHVRRGDYLKVQEEFGVLHIEYYREALRLLRSKGNTQPVWIFSDSKELINSDFIADADYPVEVIFPESDKPANETMVLMQYGSANIISNSTFSWWPAFLSPYSATVICPTQWFLSMETPYLLIPDQWEKVPSVWL